MNDRPDEVETDVSRRAATAQAIAAREAAYLQAEYDDLGRSIARYSESRRLAAGLAVVLPLLLGSRLTSCSAAATRFAPRSAARD